MNDNSNIWYVHTTSRHSSSILTLSPCIIDSRPPCNTRRRGRVRRRRHGRLVRLRRAAANTISRVLSTIVLSRLSTRTASQVRGVGQRLQVDLRHGRRHTPAQRALHFPLFRSMTVCFVFVSGRSRAMTKPSISFSFTGRGSTGGAGY